MTRKFAAIFLTMSLLVKTVYAAQPLPPGKPAGVDHAQIWNAETLAVIGGGAAIVVGFALLISGGTSVVTPIGGGSGNSVVFAPTTTTTTK